VQQARKLTAVVAGVVRKISLLFALHKRWPVFGVLALLMGVCVAHCVLGGVCIEDSIRHGDTTLLTVVLPVPLFLPLAVASGCCATTTHG
jgi:hypothetical protein